MPTGQAITPNLVPREVFPSAVAVNSTLFQTGVIIGPALGGLLLLWGPQAAYGTVLCLLTLASCCWSHDQARARRRRPQALSS